jgi:hypothetical protein
MLSIIMAATIAFGADNIPDPRDLPIVPNDDSGKMELPTGDIVVSPYVGLEPLATPSWAIPGSCLVGLVAIPRDGKEVKFTADVTPDLEADGSAVVAAGNVSKIVERGTLHMSEQKVPAIRGDAIAELGIFEATTGKVDVTLVVDGVRQPTFTIATTGKTGRRNTCDVHVSSK